MPYAPEAGDLIWADFHPRIGREQSGRRPALVVSPADFRRVTEFAIVCPITSRVRPFGMSAVLPPGLPIAGEILTSHIRGIDTQARPIRYAGAAVSNEIAKLVRAKLDAERSGRRQKPGVTAHSMTSSVRTKIDGGTVRPSALAVLRLTTSSKSVGC